MKRIFIFLIVSVFSVGCQQQNSMALPPSKVQLGPKTSVYVQITAEQNTFASSNLLRAGVKGVNNSSANKEIIYRFVWLDAHGFEIKGLPSRWKRTILLRKTPFSLDMIASSPKATDYIVHIQESPDSQSNHSQGNE